MENQQTELPVAKPEGFSKIFGRIIAIILLIVAALVGFVSFSGDGTGSSSPAPVSQEQGIRLN